MLETQALATHAAPVVWNQTTVLEKGMQFLDEKNEEVNLLRDLWYQSMGLDYYSSASRPAFEKMKAVAQKAKNEVETLEKLVTQLYEIESEKDPLSAESKQLLKITAAARHGFSYFNSIVEDPIVPNNFNWALRAAWIGTNKLAASIAVLSAAMYLSDAILKQDLPSYVYLPVKATLAACINMNAMRFLNAQFRLNRADERIEQTKNLFKHALFQEKIAV